MMSGLICEIVIMKKVHKNKNKQIDSNVVVILLLRPYPMTFQMKKM